MQIKLYENTQLTTKYLPDKIKGKYWLEHETPNKDTENYLSIEANDGSWVLVATKFAYLLDDQMQKCNKVVISNIGVTSITAISRRTGEQSLVVCSRVNPSEIVYKKLIVANNSELTIGSDGSNDVVVASRFIAPFHAKISYKDTSFEITALDNKNGIYVNNQREFTSHLFNGDVATIMELNIIFGRNFIALNNLPSINQVNGSKLSEYPVQTIVEYTKEDQFYDDFGSKNLFFRSPRFKRDIEPINLNLDSPPGKNVPDDTPLSIALGSSLTMGMASMFTAWYTVSNTLNSGGDIASTMPTIVMSGSMMAGSLLFPVLSRRYNKRRTLKLEKVRRKKYYAYLEKVKSSLVAQGNNQAEILNENLIPIDNCLERIELRSRNLWERMPEHNDFLTLRLGVGELPLNIDFHAPAESFSVEEDELMDAMFLLSNSPRSIKDVPIPVSLKESFIMGVVGNRRQCIDFTHNIIFQLASLHSYNDLKMVFLYDDSERKDWDFVRWLPHTWSEQQTVRYVCSNDDSLKALSALFEQHFSALKGNSNLSGEIAKGQTQYVFFCTNRLLSKKADMLKNILEMDVYNGFSLVLLYDELRHLPKECDIVVETGEPAKIYNRRDISGAVQEFVIDNMPFDPHKFAVSLSNVQLDQDEKLFTLPTSMTFLEMFKADKIEHLNPLERWKENNPVLSLRAPIGVGESGELFYLDLHEKFHGPHGLIAGTTGSGKSEFIMTYILSLALNYHPNEVSFILIDYKGGGMANTFSNLPHLAGTITNLDGAAISRSLISIESELKRRQAVFSEASIKVDVSNIDIYKYQKLFREGLVDEPLQHLFIISDEFAELKTQEPEFMDQLVSAARIGRSLGVHLILATQKPAGVVDDQIWSNSRFRVCLKVQEESDSQDIIKRPDAAALTVAGRYYVQVGFDEVFELGQSAWGGAPYLPDEEQGEPVDDAIVFIDEIGRTLQEIKPPKKSSKIQNPPKQIDEITKYLHQLAMEEGIKIKPLWLEPIAEFIYQSNIEEKYYTTHTPFVLNPVIGEFDNPAAQSQEVMRIPLSASGNIVLYGSGGSGKTTFLSTLIYSTIKHHTPSEVNFYIMDFSAETLRNFLPAPHVGDVVFSTEEEKVDNLFRLITSEVAHRRKLFADYGGDYESYIRITPDLPRIIVILHNYAAFYELYEDYADEQLISLTRDGFKYGVHFLITATNTNDIRYKLEQNLGTIYSMQFNDPDDYSNIFPVREKPAIANYKGRGVFCEGEDLFEFQTAYAFEPETIFQEINDYCKQLGADYEGQRAPRVPVLPEICTVEYLQSISSVVAPLVPIGLDRLTLDIMSRSFDAFLTPVCYDVAEAKYFMQGICDVIYSQGRDLTVVMTTDEYLGEIPYPCVKTVLEVKKFVEELFELMVYRNNTYKTAVNEGKSPPVFEEKFIVINDIDSFVNRLEEMELATFEKSLFHGSDEYNIHIIVSTSNIKEVSREDWFIKHGSLDSYIWVGSGISDQYSLKIIGNSSDLRQYIADDFGYVVDKAKYRLTKLVMPNGIEDVLE